MQDLPIDQKYSLSFEEAAAWTGIGHRKLRQMVNLIETFEDLEKAIYEIFK